MGQVKIEFDIHYIWIGCYWKRGIVWSEHQTIAFFTTDIFICLIPCFPIHLVFEKLIK